MHKLKRWFAAFAVVTVIASAASGPTLTSAATDHPQSQAAAWSTWLLSSPGELRLGPPPDVLETQSELAQVQALADVAAALCGP